jgi:hypothetical protein
MNCRHCAAPLRHTFLDLGFAPPSNAYLTEVDLNKPEKYYPLRVKVCGQCWLVQTEDFAQAEELFNADYAYFSSTSTSWLAHARAYAEQMIKQFSLDQESLVIEVASNDGYLLRNFVEASIPCIGIEPTASTASAAEQLGIPVLRAFFDEPLGKLLAANGKQADLIVGNNVYAHVPDINNFTRGLTAVLKPNGVITLEFPHVMRLIEHTQFDTVYHEHFSYLSLGVITKIFDAAHLRVWDVEELSTHGGSLRVYGCLAGANWVITDRVATMLAREKDAGLSKLATYSNFQSRVEQVKNDLLSWLIQVKREGRRVAAYGAAAKGNTLLNYAGVKPDLLPYVCDASPAKQSKYLPGSHIPIVSPDMLRSDPPDLLLVLPWNLGKEVQEQLFDLKEKGVEFVTALPQLTALNL